MRYTNPRLLYYFTLLTTIVVRHEATGLGNPAPNFVKIAQNDLSLRGKFSPKNRNFRDFELLKPTFLQP